MNNIENYQNALLEFNDIKAKLNPKNKPLVDKDYWSFFISELLDNGFIECFNSYDNILLIEDIEKKIIPHLRNKSHHLLLQEEFIKDAEKILSVSLTDKTQSFDMKELLSFDIQYDDLMRSTLSYHFDFLMKIMQVTKHCAIEFLEIETQDFLKNIQDCIWNQDEKKVMKMISDKFSFMKKLNNLLFNYLSLVQNDWCNEHILPKDLITIEKSLNKLSKIIAFYEKVEKSSDDLILHIKEKINVYQEYLKDMHDGDCTAFPASCMRCHSEEKFALKSTVTFGKSDGSQMYSKYIKMKPILPVLKEARDIEIQLDMMDDKKSKTNKI